MRFFENISGMSFTGSGFHFANPWVLILIPVLWILFFLLSKRNKKKQDSIIIPDTSGIKTKTPFKVGLLKYLPLFKIAGWSLMMVALARPQLALKDESIKANGIDIMLALDVSSSMLSKDFEPDRLTVIKKVASDFIKKREFDRMGLVIFSGEAFTQCPLTTDHIILGQFLSIVNTGFLQDGTAIGMGLATAVNRLKDSKAKSKVIILMTDGVNNAGYIKPNTAIELAKTLGIKVYTIGIGSRGEALAPVGRRYDGSYIYGLSRVEIDEALLQNIANDTGGKYFRATNTSELLNIYGDINKMEKTVIDVKTLKKNSEEFRMFLLTGLLFLFLEWGIRNLYIKPLFV
ncbi:MAG TPA: VWA domain-containing protein [Saprospiraceae bacterium]|nr:VWA domain-containing protein [Saprospiraceae bacterium]